MKEHRYKEAMIDNRMVKDSHQEGIERVKQRRSEYNPKDCEGHHGKMGKNISSLSHFSRRGDTLTPRKA